MNNLNNFEVISTAQACSIAGGRSEEVADIIREVGRLIGSLIRKILKPKGKETTPNTCPC